MPKYHDRSYQIVGSLGVAGVPTFCPSAVTYFVPFLMKLVGENPVISLRELIILPSCDAEGVIILSQFFCRVVED